MKSIVAVVLICLFLSFGASADETILRVLEAGGAYYTLWSPNSYPVYFGDPDLSGTIGAVIVHSQVTDEDLLLRFFGLRPGDEFTQAQLTRSVARLSQLVVFSEARVMVLPAGEQMYVVFIGMEDTRGFFLTNEVQFFATTAALLLQGQVSLAYFNGLGRGLASSVSYNHRTKQWHAGLEFPLGSLPTVLRVGYGQTRDLNNLPPGDGFYQRGANLQLGIIPGLDLAWVRRTYEDDRTEDWIYLDYDQLWPRGFGFKPLSMATAFSLGKSGGDIFARGEIDLYALQQWGIWYSGLSGGLGAVVGQAPTDRLVSLGGDLRLRGHEHRSEMGHWRWSSSLEAGVKFDSPFGGASMGPFMDLGSVDGASPKLDLGFGLAINTPGVRGTVFLARPVSESGKWRWGSHIRI